MCLIWVGYRTTKTDPFIVAKEEFLPPTGLETVAAQDELKLYGNLKWTIWENIDWLDKNDNKTDWENKMRRVAWFDNMLSFYHAWNKMPHSQVADVLYDPREQNFKV